MPVRISSDEAIGRIQLYAYLLADAILTDWEHSLQVFEDTVEFFGDREKNTTIGDLKWISPDEFLRMCEAFPISGIHEAICAGLHGVCVNYYEDGHITIGVYAEEHATEPLQKSLSQISKIQRGPTYIVPSGGFEFAQALQLNGGTSVGPKNGFATGTLGAWIKIKDAHTGKKDGYTGKYVGISNNHVLCQFNSLQRGEEIIQPGRSDGGRSSNVVGTLDGYGVLREYNVARRTSTSNTADVAWCIPVDSNQVNPNITGLNIKPAGECDIDYDVMTFKSPVKSMGTARKVA